VLLAFAFAAGTAREARSNDIPPSPPPPTCRAAEPSLAAPDSNAPEAAATADGEFQGCWTVFPAGPCRAVYKSAAGVYQLCGRCGPTGQPNPYNCAPISSATLATGYWCS
jgi:hypothetical protein